MKKETFSVTPKQRIIALFFVFTFMNTLVPYELLYANNNGPNAPEAGGFEQVESTDMVNLGTGDFSYVLPLLNVPSPEGGYPITLNYHAGIAMDQEASWVGLGWTLNPGAISRGVNGTPDDHAKWMVNERFYDRGGSNTYETFGLGVGAPGFSIQGAMAFQNGKAVGGSVGFGVGIGDHVQIGGSLGLGSQSGQWSINGSYRKNNASIGATIGSHGVLGNIGLKRGNVRGLVTIGSSGASAAVSYAKDLGNGRGVITSVNTSGNTSVSLVSKDPAAGEKAKASRFTLSATPGGSLYASVNGVGIGASSSFNYAVSMSDYNTTSISHGVGGTFPVAPGVTVSASYDRLKVKWNADKDTYYFVSGPMHYEKVDYAHLSDDHEICHYKEELIIEKRELFSRLSHSKIKHGAHLVKKGSGGNRHNHTFGMQKNFDYNPKVFGISLARYRFKQKGQTLFYESRLKQENNYMDVYEVGLEDTGSNFKINKTNGMLPAFDNYSVSAQGLSGTMRPRRGDVVDLRGLSRQTRLQNGTSSYVYYNGDKGVDTEYVQRSNDLDLAPDCDAAESADFNCNSLKLNFNNSSSDSSEGDGGVNAPIANEPISSTKKPTYDVLKNSFGDINLKQADGGVEFYFNGEYSSNYIINPVKLITSGFNANDPVSNLIPGYSETGGEIKNHSTYIEYYTLNEVSNYFTGNLHGNEKRWSKMRNYIFPSKDDKIDISPYLANNNSGGDPESLGGDKYNEGIAGYTITATDGKKYHYTLPVFNNSKITRSFEGTISNPTRFKDRKEETRYVTHWLLTAVTGPDYIDVNNNQIVDEADYGYWTGFDYVQHSADFKWQMPYNVKKIDEDRIYTWGEKDIYYLDKVRTRTHTAFFKLEDREDSKSPTVVYSNSKLTGLEGTPRNISTEKKQSLKRLDEIVLVKNNVFKAERKQIADAFNNFYTQETNSLGIDASASEIDAAEQRIQAERDRLQNRILAMETNIRNNAINIVNLEYNYELATNTPNASTGRSTLKTLQFLGKKGKRVAPNYNFEYYNNHPYSSDESLINNWGLHKEEPWNWSLKSIKTPIGTQINIEYEEDDFSTVAATQKLEFEDYEYDFGFKESPEGFVEVVVLPGQGAFTKPPSFKSFNYVGRKVDLSFNGHWIYARVMGNCDYFSSEAYNFFNPEFFQKDFVITEVGDKYIKMVASSYTWSDFTSEGDLLESITDPYTSEQIYIDNLVGTTIGIAHYGLDIGLEDYPIRAFNAERFTEEDVDVEFENELDCSDEDERGNTYIKYNNFLKPVEDLLAGNSFTIFGEKKAKGGGIRVKRIETTDGVDSIEQNYAYTQSNKEDYSSGVISYYPYNDGETREVLPYMSLLPAPVAMYGEVKTESKVNGVSQGYQVYKFKTLTPIVKQEKNSGREKSIELSNVFKLTSVKNSGNSVTATSFKIEDHLDNLGVLQTVTSYNSKDQILHKTINTYKQGTENTYKQGIVKESYITLKELYPFKPVNPEAVQADQLAISSTEVTKYPSVLQKTKVITAGHNSTTEFYDYDNNSGMLLLSKNYDSNGRAFIRKLTPAYHIPQYNYLMGPMSGRLLVLNETGTENPTASEILREQKIYTKNMLTQIAKDETFILEKDADGDYQVNSVGVKLTKWLDYWTYSVATDSENYTTYSNWNSGNLDFMITNYSNGATILNKAETHIKSKLNIAGTGVLPSYLKGNYVMRVYKEFTYNTSVSKDGKFDSQIYKIDLENVNWGSATDINNDRFLRTSKYSQYDNYSYPIMKEDINGNYVSTKMGDNNSKITVVCNSAYADMYYSGMEYGSEQGVTLLGNVKVDDKKAHTGSHYIEATTGGQTVLTVKIPELSTNQTKQRGKDFKVSLWVNTQSIEDKYDYPSIEFNNNTYAFNENETEKAGDWLLLNGIVPIPLFDNEQGLDLKIKASKSGQKIDDFRLYPVSSSMTNYVYNQWDELSYIIGDNGLATHYKYNDGGELFKVYTEVIDYKDNGHSKKGGFRKIAEHSKKHKN